MSDIEINQRIAREYCDLMELKVADTDLGFRVIVHGVSVARRDEPRISTGEHFVDWSMICDDDDTIESFYGADYFGNEKFTETKTMKSAIEMISERRAHQIGKGNDSAHDDGHADGALYKAAGVLLAHGTECFFDFKASHADSRWINELAEDRPDRVDALVEAAAMIVAEVERLQRIGASGEGTRGQER